MPKYPGLLKLIIDYKPYYIALGQIVSITRYDSQRITIVDNNNKSIDVNMCEGWVDDLLERWSTVQGIKK